MMIKIGSRKSDLARIQAYVVAEALKKSSQTLNIEHIFKSSLGDDNLDQPLYRMAEKGVFTKDFTEDLVAGRVDMVVHSWKDLPTEPNPLTEVVATLPRADRRDMLLVKRESVPRVLKSKQISLLSSSPRRAYNLVPFLKWALPFNEPEIEFKDVRGNIPTRLTKLFENKDVDGLVLAKAAVDRLLGSGLPEFESTARNVQSLIDQCLLMILPMKECPPAAAQGALAIEIRKDRADLRTLLSKINCVSTFNSVTKERSFLASKGGGCHQKIGVTYFDHPLGTVFSSKGLTDSGETLLTWNLEGARVGVMSNMRDFFPKTKEDGKLLSPQPVEFDLEKIRSQKSIWLAKGSGWPKELSPDPNRCIWVAGSDTWKYMARLGHWIRGSSEGLGDLVKPNLTKTEWLKLTHVDAVQYSTMPALGTYRLLPISDPDVDIVGVTHFFWTSYSNFEEGLRRWPHIRDGHHACGPGQSYDLIRSALGRDASRLQVFISYEEWREQLPRKKVD